MKLKSKNIIGCACIIFDPVTNKVLITKRQDVPIWTFPGGTREENENPIDCVVREIKEEIGLKVVKPIHFATYLLKNKCEKYLYYSIYQKDNIVVDRYEVSGYKWISLDSVPKSIGLYNIEIINNFKNYIKTKKVTRRYQKIDFRKELLVLLTSNPFNFLRIITKYIINRFTKKSFKLG